MAIAGFLRLAWPGLWRPVRAFCPELADRVEQEHARILVTRNGRAAFVLVSPDDLSNDPDVTRREANASGFAIISLTASPSRSSASSPVYRR